MAAKDPIIVRYEVLGSTLTHIEATLASMATVTVLVRYRVLKRKEHRLIQ